MAQLALAGLGGLLLLLAIRGSREPRLLLPLGGALLVGSLARLAAACASAGCGAGCGLASVCRAADLLGLGVTQGTYAPLLFFALGASTDLSPLLANPRLFFVGAASALGLVSAFAAAAGLGLDPRLGLMAGVAGLADGPAAAFVGSGVAAPLLAPAALCACLWGALGPGLQAPLLKLCTTVADRATPTQPGRLPGRSAKLLLPSAGLVVAALAAPRTAPLLGLFFLGNLLRESGAAEGLTHAARTTLLEIVTALFGLGLGLAADAEQMLASGTVALFALGGVGLVAATLCGVFAVKALNLLPGARLNPLIGAAGAVLTPDAARLAQILGSREQPTTYLLAQARAAGSAGVVGALVAAGVLWSMVAG